MGLAAFNRMRREQAEREAQAQQEQEATEKPINKLNVAELKEKLTSLNIEFDESAKKADLLALLENALNKSKDESQDQAQQEQSGDDQEDQAQEENQPE